MNATHEELEKGLNEAVLALGPLAYEPGKLTSTEAWALGILTGTALRMLALLRDGAGVAYWEKAYEEQCREALQEGERRAVAENAVKILEGALERVTQSTRQEVADMKQRIGLLERALTLAVRETELMRSHETFLPTGWEEEARKLLSGR